MTLLIQPGRSLTAGVEGRDRHRGINVISQESGVRSILSAGDAIGDPSFVQASFSCPEGGDIYGRAYLRGEG
jgi:hypothetical protein